MNRNRFYHGLSPVSGTRPQIDRRSQSSCELHQSDKARNRWSSGERAAAVLVSFPGRDQFRALCGCSDRSVTDRVTEVAHCVVNSRVTPAAVMLGHLDNLSAKRGHHPRTASTPTRAPVIFLRISLRCHASSVYGVTKVAISRSVFQPRSPFPPA